MVLQKFFFSPLQAWLLQNCLSIHTSANASSVDDLSLDCNRALWRESSNLHRAAKQPPSLRSQAPKFRFSLDLCVHSSTTFLRVIQRGKRIAVISRRPFKAGTFCPNGTCIRNEKEEKGLVWDRKGNGIDGRLISGLLPLILLTHRR